VQIKGDAKMSIEKEMKQIGRNRKEELAELYARIEVLERNLKAFKNYVKYKVFLEEQWYLEEQVVTLDLH
jgi:hypothetical protein